jgi:hypothetical protein
MHGFTLRDLGLGTRTHNVLARNGITTLAQLLCVGPLWIRHMKGAGENSVAEISAALGQCGMVWTDPGRRHRHGADEVATTAPERGQANEPRVTRPLIPRLLTREQAAKYLGDVAVATIDGLINSGTISIVRLSLERFKKTGVSGVASDRGIRIDREELDALIAQWRDSRP